MDWFIDTFYVEGDMIKTFLGVFGLCIFLLFILDGFWIIKSAVKSAI